MKVTYNKKEYLVTKNSFVSDSSPSLNVARAADADGVTVETQTDAELAKNIEYINKYITKEFRANLLEEELGITNCMELFLKSYSRTNDAGIASLTDEYEIFNADGKKVAKIRQVWNSGLFVSYFFPEVESTDNARAEKFIGLGEDTVREYDPHTIFIDVTDSSNLENNKCIELVYNYYKDTHADITEDDEKYKKIDLDSLPTTRKDNLGYAKVTVDGKSKLVPAYRKETSSYSTNYCLQDSSWSRYAVLSFHR